LTWINIENFLKAQIFALLGFSIVTTQPIALSVPCGSLICLNRSEVMFYDQKGLKKRGGVKPKSNLIHNF